MNLKKTSSTILTTSIKLVLYLLIGVIIYLVLSNAFLFGEMVFSEDGMAPKGSGVEIQITIPENASAKAVGDILEKNGLINNSYVFVLQVFLYDGEISSGKYILNTEYSPEEIIETLRNAANSGEE
ncbi:MAG: endolytic transglycosylase MltG [Lachnospiraceae bacterium]|nr:endolytic transglycosylase MltG [Lachnospiraceae bacterium]